ncbi:hypothetical protein H9623_11690 [Oerskovia sp. Sa1BUA8]|uniref:Uncharacterized protein n=1 Tax=Oerskovia douganii TaxID=2762210 RepID=A0A9D5YZ92_9CELL|nr:hypothetical protein [Oerskovia douganii]MBE7700960.1 hypothetical protein [Oerskovia douganii]
MSFATGTAVAGVVVATLVLSVLGGMLVTPWVLRAAARRSAAEGEVPPVRDPGPVPPPPGRTSPATGPGAATATRVPVPPPPAPDPAAGAAPSGPGDPLATEAVQTLRGGTWIGILERLAITGCLLAGYPAGIAFVVAIKGLGRYPELREHPVGAERFMIGTLASMIWAGATGLLGAAILGLLR